MTNLLILFVIITALFFIAVIAIWAYIWGKFIKELLTQGVVREPIPRPNLRQFCSYKVSRLMKTQPLVTADPKEKISEVMHKMRRADVRFLPVTDNGTLKGVVTDGDIINALCLKEIDVDRETIASIMVKDVISVGIAENMGTVLKLMSTKKVRHVPVVDEGKLEGIVSLTDIGFREEGPFSMA